MSRNRKPLQSINRAIAEDAAIKYLMDEFPLEVAAAIATTAELLLAIRWDEELQVLIDRNDPRKVFVIYEDQMRAIRKAFTEIPRGTSDPRGEQHLFNLFRDLPTDWAWSVARRVREYVVHQRRLAALLA